MKIICQHFWMAVLFNASSLKERTFEIIQVSADSPKPFDMKATGKVVKYNGALQTIQL